MIATSNNSVEVVKLLIDAGADVDARSEKGTTALMLAAKNSKGVDVINLLLEKGADVNARDDKGNTALTYATNKDSEVQAEIIALLKQHGAVE